MGPAYLSTKQRKWSPSEATLLRRPPPGAPLEEEGEPADVREQKADGEGGPKWAKQ